MRRLLLGVGIVGLMVGAALLQGCGPSDADLARRAAECLINPYQRMCGYTGPIPPDSTPSPRPSPPPTVAPTPQPIPSVAPSPVPPEPSPTPQPAPSTIPTPIPSPTPAPAACDITTGRFDAIELDVDPPPQFCEDVNQAITAATCVLRDGGCAWSSDCPVPWDATEYFRRVNAALRAVGFCTGVDVDQIAVGHSPNEPFEFYHAFNYNGKAIWCVDQRVHPGNGNKGSYRGRGRWVNDGSAPPSPDPTPEPSAPPSPQPTPDPNRVASAVIQPTHVTVRPGAPPVQFMCTARNSAGQVIYPPADNVFCGSCLRPGCLNKDDFTCGINLGAPGAAVKVNPRAHAGTIEVNCAWYQAGGCNGDPRSCNTPNAVLEVRP